MTANPNYSRPAGWIMAASFAVCVVATGLALHGGGACTPAEQAIASPVVRAGGLVCLMLPDEPHREVCSQARDLADAVLRALAEQPAPAAAPDPSSSAPSPDPSSSAAGAPAGVLD